MTNLCRCLFFFFSSRRRHTRFDCDWSSNVCSSDLPYIQDDSIAGFPLVESPVQRKPVIDENVGTDGVPENGINDGRCRLSFVAEKLRSEERRVGKECRSRWSPYH